MKTEEAMAACISGGCSGAASEDILEKCTFRDALDGAGRYRNGAWRERYGYSKGYWEYSVHAKA